ncbi:E3 ubiquitin-protein ligase WAV3-like [Carex rostrata]
MSFNDDEEIVIPKGPKPIVPGRIQLDIRNNTNAPIAGINQKVLLQLTGKGEGRAGLDLVAVLDVSGSMGEDDKIGKMKLALQFMMKKLTPLDRLSIVKYSTKATRVCKLTQMTEKSQTELANLIEGLKATGSTNITDGLTMGLNVLNGRTIRDGRVGVIMLMTDGQENKSSDASKVKCNVTVHTFGFGDGQDSKRLTDIAKNSPNGGTYSEVRLENLNLAFSQCLAGLLSVVAQELTVTVEQEGSKIKPPVSAGSYKQSNPTAGSVTITFGDLYIQEVRTVLVDIDIPRADMEGATDVLAVSFSYKFGGELEEAPPSFVSVNRLEGFTDEELLAPPEVRAEEVRLLIAELIKEATDNAEKNDLASAQQNLSEGLETLEKQDVEQLKATLSNELNELKRLMETKKTYDKEGRPFANSLLISLATQRQAARGEDISQFQLFSTPAMQQLLKEAQESNDKDKLKRYVDDLIKALEAVEQVINQAP